MREVSRKKQLRTRKRLRNRTEWFRARSRAQVQRRHARVARVVRLARQGMSLVAACSALGALDMPLRAFAPLVQVVLDD